LSQIVARWLTERNRTSHGRDRPRRGSRKSRRYQETLPRMLAPRLSFAFQL
jgi:hypothetical protein